MKKQIVNLLFLAVVSLSTVSCAQEKTVSVNEIPKDLKVYIDKNFPNNNVLQATQDKEALSTTYKVMLQDNIELEFDKDNNIVEISSTGKLPDSVIPASLLSYVKQNFPNNFITKWELDDNEQQLELDNGTELEFSKTGEFIKIDN